MVEKGTKAWADTPNDWVDELRGGIESCTKVGTKSGVLPTEWVWLTDTEIDEIMRPLTQNQPFSWRSFGHAIARRLKEKNG
jgi:hypothetical protein